MNKPIRIVFWGFILWLTCFIIGFVVFPLHESDVFLFKTIMIVASTIIGTLMFIHYFGKVESNFLSEGITIGIVWFVVNMVLDLIVLVGMLKTPLVEYLLGTGLRYINIPVMSSGIGFILSRKFK